MVRRMVGAAFAASEEGSLTEADWRHTAGGVRFLVDLAGSIVGHAAVIERELHVGDRPLRTGYVEGVAVVPDLQRKGLGTVLMRSVNGYIAERFELGALGTGSHQFYERLGWRTWHGPTSVRSPQGLRRTPDEDGFIMILPTAMSPPLDDSLPISCDWRQGDAW